MARKEHGTIPQEGERQPGGVLVYNQNGLVEGVITYIYDADVINSDYLSTKLGRNHPDDDNVFLYSARVRNDSNGLTVVDYDCIGIVPIDGNGDKTTPHVSFPNSVSQERIETHPQFREGISADQTKKPGALAGYGDPDATTRLAIGNTKQDGTGTDLTTGARWHMSQPAPVGATNAGKRTEEGFAGFIGPEAPVGLRGVTSYFQGNTMAVITYYTRNTPQLLEACTIQDPVGVDLPSIYAGNKWLHLVSSCEQIGKANIWRVTEQYIAGTNNIVSDYIYKSGTARQAAVN